MSCRDLITASNKINKNTNISIFSWTPWTSHGVTLEMKQKIGG
ncbi:hypothetical protein RBEAN4_1155 [Rickettsia bellii str. RML An4]|uniref:Uncharacterized protein n=1 Tax=Rickettsia bellii str. RML An4 TaxID=1359193 RepID=A0A0F3QC91_RICBE|nr:hypothetical protein RBEAN4_1155 [Rickettsia bellii str. RML An4]